jgi:hypothetical protein
MYGATASAVVGFRSSFVIVFRGAPGGGRAAKLVEQGHTTSPGAATRRGGGGADLDNRRVFTETLPTFLDSRCAGLALLRGSLPVRLRAT